MIFFFNKIWIQQVTFKNKAICMRKIFIFFSLKKKRDGPKQEVAQGMVPSPILNPILDLNCKILKETIKNEWK